MVICSGLNGTANLSRAKPEPLPKRTDNFLLALTVQLQRYHTRPDSIDFSAGPPQHGPPCANVLRHRMRDIMADISIQPIYSHVDAVDAGRSRIDNNDPTQSSMDDELYRERARHIRELADKADPFIRKRLLNLAGN